MKTGQLPLPLQWNESTEREDFFIGDCNRNAYQWLFNGRITWGHHASFLIGPPKSGKSHLSAIFAQKFGGIFASARAPNALLKFTRDTPSVLILDDLGADIDEVSLFHIYNHQHLNGGTLLMIAEDVPRSWPVHLPDLASRLDATSKVIIDVPDDNVLSAMLIKQLRDKGWSVTPEVIAYLLPRMERSFYSAHRLAEVLHECAEDDRRNLTVPLAADVLKRIYNEPL
jgi:chromosomal replication initiation ATPase DnaA